jgi:hypothetical protein
MKITKQSETFSLSDTTELFEMSGSASQDINGSLHINFSVNKVGGEYVGNCNYSKYADASNVNFGVNCPEEAREEFTTYADSVIDFMLEHFNTLS